MYNLIYKLIYIYKFELILTKMYNDFEKKIHHSLFNEHN